MYKESKSFNSKSSKNEKKCRADIGLKGTVVNWEWYSLN